MFSLHSVWFLFIGLLMVSAALARPMLQKLWLTVPIIQLLIGLAVSPALFDLLDIRWQRDAKFLEVISEVAVIISLYATGIKIRLPTGTGRQWRPWLVPVTLASATMTVTVVATAATAVWLLELPWAFALLLAAVMAPTDPVLADEVQIEDAEDEDQFRRALTGEAGLNDGTAFPFVLLAMGLISSDLHELGDYWWRWVAFDVFYKIAVGLLVGYFGGRTVGHLVLRFCRNKDWFVGMDELVTLGLICVVYGIALAIDTYAFLAVFATAVTMRRLERIAQKEDTGQDNEVEVVDKRASDDRSLPPLSAGDTVEQSLAHPARALVIHQTRVGATLERIAQVFLVIVVGALLHNVSFDDPAVWGFTAMILFMIRPLAVIATIWPYRLFRHQIMLISWFGIRGIGTVYYLTFALANGVDKAPQPDIAPVLDAATLTITASIILHGISGTPLMLWYRRRCQREACVVGD